LRTGLECLWWRRGKLNSNFNSLIPYIFSCLQPLSGIGSGAESASSPAGWASIFLIEEVA